MQANVHSPLLSIHVCKIALLASASAPSLLKVSAVPNSSLHCAEALASSYYSLPHCVYMSPT